jgi:hypothetical protein
MKGYKAFNKGLICKGKQYKENETFEEERAVPCHRGMHFCKNPFDVLNFYDLVDENGEFSDFAEVEAPDDAEVKTDDDIKYCTTKLKVGAKFSFAGFVKTCVDFVIEKTQTEKPDSGNSAQIGSSGNSAKIGSSGYSAQIGSSGNSAKIGSSGDSAQIGSSGNSAKIGSSGDSAQIGSSGDSAQIGSSGDSAQIGSSGDSAQIGSSGNSAQIGSSGYSAKIKSTGYDSIICCAGDDSCVSAKKGSWITLAEWKYSYEKDRYVPKCVKTEYVDGERIKEDTMYKLIDGEFTEV